MAAAANCRRSSLAHLDVFDRENVQRARIIGVLHFLAKAEQRAVAKQDEIALPPRFEMFAPLRQIAFDHDVGWVMVRCDLARRGHRRCRRRRCRIVIAHARHRTRR